MCTRTNLQLLLILLVLSQLLGCQNRATQRIAGATPQAARSEKSPIVTEPASAGYQIELKLLPVDEASQDPSFERFRMRLLAAAKNHDTAFILSILDQHILNSLGGSGGVKEFKEQWKLDETGDEFWNTLIAVLTKGGPSQRATVKKNFVRRT